MKTKEMRLGGLRVKIFRLNDVIIGVTTDVGPRVLYLASGKRPDFNLFGVLPRAGMETPAGFWKLYGGHRLWTSPEATPRSYSMDDKPVKISTGRNGILVRGNIETENSVQKEIEIAPVPGRGVRVTHTVRNTGRWPVELACWALSVMRKEGFAVIPLKPQKTDKKGLLPDRHISLWPYTELSDERLTFKKSHLSIRQSPAHKNPIKVGTMANPAWTAYWTEGLALVKSFVPEKVAYPDFGCSVEVYANSEMLELETVGPLKAVEPSDCARHTEFWNVFETENDDPDSLVNEINSFLGRHR